MKDLFVYFGDEQLPTLQEYMWDIIDAVKDCCKRNNRKGHVVVRVQSYDDTLDVPKHLPIFFQLVQSAGMEAYLQRWILPAFKFHRWGMHNWFDPEYYEEVFATFIKECKDLNVKPIADFEIYGENPLKLIKSLDNQLEFMQILLDMIETNNFMNTFPVVASFGSTRMGHPLYPFSVIGERVIDNRTRYVNSLPINIPPYLKGSDGLVLPKYKRPSIYQYYVTLVEEAPGNGVSRTWTPESLKAHSFWQNENIWLYAPKDTIEICEKL